MKEKQNATPEAAELRRRAEARVKKEHKNAVPSEEAARRLLHELQVHQIELEMQNEELRQARMEAEAALQRYTELYDFAPVGYFTLESQGNISKANLAAARMLKVERAKLIGRRFENFVAALSQHTFNTFINKIPGEQAKASCEVELVTADGDAAFVLIEAIAGQSGNDNSLVVIDITERKQIELNLLAVQIDLDGILNAIPDLLFEWGLDGHIYNYKTSRADLLAVPPEIFLGRRLSEVLPPEVATVCLTALQEANENGNSMGRQYELTLGQERKWFELSVSSKTGIHADQPHFIVLVRDITERKQTEQNLFTLYTAIEQSPISVVIADVDANIQYVNPHFTEVTGYTAAEALGQNPRIFRSGQTQKETYQDMWGKINSGQVWHGEFINKRKNGELYWEEAHIAPVTDAAGNTVNYVCLKVDITQRRQAEEELHESEFRWKFALEGAGDGVWDWDMQTGKVIFSERYKEMLGYAGNEAWSSLNEWKDRVNVEDMHHAMQELEAYLDGKRTLYTAEYRMRCKDGGWKWMLVRGMVVERAAGDRPLRMIGTHTDISKIREAEQRTRELLRQNRALTRRMFSMQEKERRHLASELHDELGQWLTAIQAEAHAIDSIAGAASPIHNSVQAISESASTMHEVIHRMVHNLRPSLLDALGLADSLHELKKQWYQPHLGVACDFVLEDDLSDLGENLNITIYRLVQEALSNAAKYAQANRVSLRLCRVRGETRDADAILLSIEDDGAGFDVGQPTRGAGILGMRERVIAAGGKFDLASAPGQGVRISVRLPLKQMGENYERREA